MYTYQDEILTIAKRKPALSTFKKAIEEPLHCLLQNYKNEGGYVRYSAGACLRRLMGAPEIKGFHRGKNYDYALKALIFRQIAKKDLLHDSELSFFAAAEWDEYQPFCQGIAAEEDCVELLPNQKQIQKQSELLGASSMMVLRSAYKQFSGDTKKRVQDLIVKLYMETPKEQYLKRKVINEIYREMTGSLLELKNS